MKKNSTTVPAVKPNKIKNSNWQFWAIIALPMIYAFVFAYIPMGGIIIAFKDYSIRRGILGKQVGRTEVILNSFSLLQAV